ncbi:DNA alkylation repair protein [Leptospira alstonii]|uniref:DNA alkylation repair enzyme domain protein n=2 Tax=Leptospira alstonii TaxID=28452 RepID=M6CV73_9LEPT|nr:DNA alkylation repair protein [Leptospira alstonii]EMJ95614.1 DNA alkylation repair enzyme domain protein [Leptospira alstonii serovar Sichuan str. 79601]EQA81477.1 DNA alkylation repair enzyme domain protein [Leptospira alstonii serovar Pingchang str. 80-412]
MAELLKDLYSKNVLERIATSFSEELPSVPRDEWIRRFKQKDWRRLELKQRIRRIGEILAEALPKPFPKTMEPLLKITDSFEESFKGKEVFLTIFLGDVVEILGMDHPKESMQAIERITKLISCEFSIRPFLIRHPELVWKQMLKWSLHENSGVRRLSSEGSRPRLPWGMGIPGLKQDPRRTLPILENLKDDEDEVVRRSVANHLNDISKDHPDLVLEIAEKWIGFSKERDTLLKHALRGLLKAGNQRALKIFGFGSKVNAKILNFKLKSKTVKIGESLSFDFTVQSDESRQTRLRIEYKIQYAKVSGKTSKKVFQIEERLFLPNESVRYEKKQSFQQMTTRVHVPGKHTLEVHINGVLKSKVDFQVVL